MNTKKIISYLILFALMAFSLMGCGNIKITANSKDVKEYNIDDIKEENIEKINQICIEDMSGDINIIPENRQNVKIHMYGKVFTTSEDRVPNLSALVEEDKLIVKSKKKSNTNAGVYNSDVKVDVYLPKSYKEKLLIDCSLANISIKNSKFISLECKLNVGEIEMENLEVETFNVKASTANIEGKRIKTQDSKVEVSLGNIDIDEFDGNLEATVSSGDIDICYSKLDYDIELTSTLGDISLMLPNNVEFDLDTEVSLGSIECEFPVNIKEKADKKQLKGKVKNGENKVKIRASSGDVKIKQKIVKS
ncbi:DUF4097 family beta strand repeat-containing protein [Clostridium aestuarii]|uniref:DUF4097 family beta strand repeat-containing protein n=1 Tax=Clostridium aestuarii TaxID=338193 RepID=A0ABT4D6C9_9CLOT|nr:DUF4097 family beta strand repeat-containing protein [Clostridium aestuarii]MCY6485735.1 DUF4097 family beta strand repeat-containing protein [Clostridium aestuarii]